MKMKSGHQARPTFLAANYDWVKGYVRAQILRQVLNYLSKDPARNFLRMLYLTEKFVALAGHKRQVHSVAEVFNTNPAIREYIERFKNVHPNVKQRLIYNWVVNAQLLGIPKQRKLSDEYGFSIPNLILIDPTSACNLRCIGCWAGEYPKHDTLDFKLLDRIITEAKQLGIYWISMSGGEPFLYRHLFDLAAKHDDVAFMLYTNGTLITDQVADKIVEVGNISPAISLEGWRERTDARRGQGVFDKIVAGMDRLRERGAIFGFSITITRHNVEEVTSDEFIDFLIAKGAFYGWTFHYIPIGRQPNVELMITPEQRAYLAERIPYIRTHKPIQVADFWNDGELTHGCIAGGRRYFHITAAGDVEPCAFVHFSQDNIKDKSLLEVLGSKLFKAYQKRQSFSDNYLRPCPIIDVPSALREIVTESGAHPTHTGAETVLSGEIGEFLDTRSEDWAAKAAPLWERRRKEQSDRITPKAG